MTTVTQFAPTANAPFQFQATLTGPTALVSATGTTFDVIVPWNVTAQRWYLLIVDQNGNLVLNRSLVGSPADYPINLIGGYFTESSLVFFESTQQFVVTP